MNILVTGGLGFIGSHLVKKLVKEGHSLVVLDKSKKNMERISEIKDKIKFIKKDVRKYKGVSDFDVVYHLAAISSVSRCEKNPKKALSVNVTGTLNLLKNNPKKFIYPSSAAIYAEKGKRVINSYDRLNPSSIYGYTKKWADELVDYYDGIVVRIPNVYGPYSQSVVTKFVKMALEGKKLTIFGKGDQMRTFVYVDDIVDNLIKIGLDGRKKLYQLGAPSEFYKSVNDIVEILEDKISVEAVHKPKREYEIKYSLLAYEKSDLNLKPKIKLEKGIEKLIQYHKRKFD